MRDRPNKEKNKIDDLEALLEAIQPSPGEHFYERMRRAPWMVSQPHRTPWRRLAFAGLLVTLGVIAMLLASPTLASRISSFFWFASGDRRELKLTKAFESYPGLNGGSEDFPLTFAEAQALASFSLKQLDPPAGFRFTGGRYDPATQAAMLRYSAEGQVILLTQRKLGAVEEYSSVGGSAEVEKIEVREAPGEYVRGSWLAAAGASTPGTPLPLTWEPDLPYQALRWAQDGIVYELFASFAENIQKQDLLDMANGLK